MRQKIGALTEALTGRFNTHHGFMTRLFLDRIDAHSADIARLDARIEEAMAPFRAARDLLTSIPGFSRIVAEVRGSSSFCRPAFRTDSGTRVRKSKRHLTILTPPPDQKSSKEEPWDRSVELHAAANATHLAL
jgi:transposase